MLNKILKGAGAFLIILSLFMPGTSLAAQKDQASLASQFSQEIVAHANGLIQNAWTNIAQKYGIQYTQCKNRLEELSSTLKQQIESNNRSLRNQARQVCTHIKNVYNQVCADYNINPTTYSIMHCDLMNLAACDDYIIYVNERDLQNQTVNAQHFIIGHEIGHCQNKDTSMSCILEQTINRYYTYETSALSHAIEYRADISSLLRGPKYAKGAIDFFENEITQGRDGDSFSHPAASKRLAMAKRADALYNQQKQITYQHIMQLIPSPGIASA